LDRLPTVREEMAESRREHRRDHHRCWSHPRRSSLMQWCSSAKPLKVTGIISS